MQEKWNMIRLRPMTFDNISRFKATSAVLYNKALLTLVREQIYSQGCAGIRESDIYLLIFIIEIEERSFHCV